MIININRLFKIHSKGFLIFIANSILLYFVVINVYGSIWRNDIRDKKNDIIVVSNEFIETSSILKYNYELLTLDVELGRDKIAYEIKGNVLVDDLSNVLISNGFSKFYPVLKINDIDTFSKGDYLYFIVIEKYEILNRIYPFISFYICVNAGKHLGNFLDMLGMYFVIMFMTIFSLNSFNKIKYRK